MVLARDTTFNAHAFTTGRGQRTETFTFELIDGVTNEHKRFLHPFASSAPTLSHDVTRTIPRTVSNVNLSETDTEAVNVVRDRVLISMNVGDDSYPLGRYMFADQSSARFTFGVLSAVNLVDEMFIVDQPLSEGFTTTNVANRGDLVARLLLTRYLITSDVESSVYRLSGSWSTGTSGASVLNDIARDGNFFHPWCDNNGVLRLIQSFDVLGRVPDIDWDASNSIIQGSISETNDLINAPNRFIVIASGGVDITSPIVGKADVPSSAPHSINNRGFVIPDVRELQVTGVTHASVIARNLVRNQTLVERTELQTTLDPRHDGHQVIRWRGINWLEVAWSMQLTAGGVMNHTLARRYE